MSWLYSRALVEEYSGENFLDGEQSAQSSSTNTPAMFLSQGKTTEALNLSRYGMTFALLMEDHEDTIILKEGYTTEEYVSLISNLDFLIGMRLHALVFSALAGVPFLAVSYDPKVDRFVKGMEGTAAGSIDKISCEDILRESARMWRHVPEKQNAKIQILREEAQRNAARAISLLPKC